MEAKDFRIGNIVFAYTNTETAKIRAIGLAAASLETARGNKRVELEALLPIPLTEEILLKCGMSINNKGFALIKCGSTMFKLTPPKTMGEWQNVYCWVFDEYKFIEVPYLHTFQNLFYLMGEKEELTVNL